MLLLTSVAVLTMVMLTQQAISAHSMALGRGAVGIAVEADQTVSETVRGFE